ncbi:MAG: DNA polymerase IV [Planctomycetota bacterium]
MDVPPPSSPLPGRRSLPARGSGTGRDGRLAAGTRRILHLDVDAFLASVEEALHPELAGRPVVVGGSPRSRNLVMSCSYAARRFGVRPGMLLAEAARRCPRAVFRDGDSQAANRLREEVTRVLLGYTPRVEVASIDDFFLDLTGTTRLLGSAFATAERIRAEVAARTRLPLSIGIATSKRMARLAGRLAKPGGVAEILPGAEEAFLAPLPVGALPGVGHAIGARLAQFAIRTVGELRLVPREILFASFGADGLCLYEAARGRDESEVETTHVAGEEGLLIARPPRSIHRESTFEPEEGRRELVEAMLAYLVERAADRLRAHRLVAGSLEVRIRTVDTRPRVERLAGADAGLETARRRRFSAPTDSTDEIWRHARALLRELPRRRALVKRVGLVLVRLSPGAGWQGRLFDAEKAAGSPHPAGSRADRHRQLDRAIDRLRAKLGFGRLLRGPSLPLAATHPLRPDGFRLRTPSLNQ